MNGGTSGTGLESALYVGRVRHARLVAPRHAFVQPLYMAWLDHAELDRAFAGRWLFGVERRRLAAFRRADHLGDPAVPLDDAVRALVGAALGRAVSGPVRTLCGLRTAGFAFNPVSFHCVFAPGGGLEAVVADVSNTPWNERHRYVLAATSGRVDVRLDKAFHVSPFLPMDHAYRFRFEPPGATLSARIESFARDDGGRSAERAKIFDAQLALVRRPLDGRSLARTLARFPAMAQQVVAGIYWQALRLHLRGARFHPHPGRARAAEAAA